MSLLCGSNTIGSGPLPTGIVAITESANDDCRLGRAIIHVTKTPNTISTANLVGNKICLIFNVE